MPLVSYWGCSDMFCFAVTGRWEGEWRRMGSLGRCRRWLCLNSRDPH